RIRDNSRADSPGASARPAAGPPVAPPADRPPAADATTAMRGLQAAQASAPASAPGSGHRSRGTRGCIPSTTGPGRNQGQSPLLTVCLCQGALSSSDKSKSPCSFFRCRRAVDTVSPLGKYPNMLPGINQSFSVLSLNSKTLVYSTLLLAGLLAGPTRASDW